LPQIALTKVDLPTLGRPTKVTNPERIHCVPYRRSRRDAGNERLSGTMYGILVT
jgi:hypothetical protein